MRSTVAGAAALVEQAYPSLTPDGVRQYLQKNARDLGPAGPDNLTGAGELQLPAPPDVVAPTAKALGSRGRYGAIVKLTSVVGDDSGEVRIVEQVKRGGHVVATMKRSHVRAHGSRVQVAWQAPQSAKGSYRHCIVATDAAGNASQPSCATISLR